MKELEKIYRDAAEIVSQFVPLTEKEINEGAYCKTSPFSCDAILDAAFDNNRPKNVNIYKRKYSEVFQHGYGDKDDWWGKWKESTEEDQLCRSIALLFAAEMARTGDIK